VINERQNKSWHVKNVVCAEVADDVWSISMSSPAYRMGVNQAETPGIKSEPAGKTKS